MIKLVNYKTYPQRGKDCVITNTTMIQEEKMKTLTNKQTTKQTNKQNHPSKKKKREWNKQRRKNNPYRYWTSNSFLVCLIHLKRLFLR